MLFRSRKVLDVLLVHDGLVFRIGETIYSSFDFNIDKAIIIDNVIKIVEINHFMWHYVVRCSNAFSIFEFRIKIEIFNAYGATFGVGGRHH